MAEGTVPGGTMGSEEWEQRIAKGVSDGWIKALMESENAGRNGPNGTQLVINIHYNTLFDDEDEQGIVDKALELTRARGFTIDDAPGSNPGPGQYNGKMRRS